MDFIYFRESSLFLSVLLNYSLVFDSLDGISWRKIVRILRIRMLQYRDWSDRYLHIMARGTERTWNTLLSMKLFCL